GEAQHDADNEGEKSRVEGNAHAAENFQQGILDLAHVPAFTGAKHRAESTAGITDTDNSSNETHDWNGPKEHLHHSITAVRFGGVNFGKGADHLCDFRVVLANVEELESLANPVHDVGVPKSLGEIDDVIVKGLEV